MHIDLASLPKEHALRNSSLVTIRAEYRPPGGGVKKWLPITEKFAISKNTYNELGDVWKLMYLFRVPGELAPELVPAPFPKG